MRALDFNPTDVYASELVDREQARDELLDDVSRYLRRADSGDRSRTWAIIGDKGIGKSILTRWVLDQLRDRCSGGAVIATVDCRERRGWREVLAGLSFALLAELRSLKAAGSESVSDALVAAAELLDELARLDEATLKVFHERARGFKTRLGLQVAMSLLRVLKADLGLELDLEQRVVETLSGSRSFDEDRLNRAICALCRDIRRAGLQVVLYLDNIDELDHDYHDDAARRRVRRDVEGLLKLDQAPVALILNMRTYFSQVLPRRLPEARRLAPLGADTLLEIVSRRIAAEDDPSTREAFADSDVRGATRRLAELAPTPLAFLTWFHFLFRREFLHVDRLEEGFSRFVYNHHASLTDTEIRLRAVMELFASPTSAVARDRLLEVCEGSHYLLRKLEYTQVVLPEDFWAPERYTLDPIFQTFHPLLVGRQSAS